MRAFVILSVIAVASAGRLGYNYQQGVSGSNDFLSSGSGMSPVLALGSGQGVGGGSSANFVSGNAGFGSDFGGQAQGSGISYGLGAGSIGSGFGGGINYGPAGQSFGSGSNIGSGSFGSGIGGGLGSGINYGSAGQSFGSGSNIGSGSFGSGIGGGLGSGINYGSAGQSFGSGLNIGSGSIGSGIGGGLGSGINYGSSGSVGGGISYEPATNRVIDGGLSKEYFIYTAPEEQAQQGHNTQSVNTYLKKNLRVIFIKAPENNGVHNAALQIAKQATEDRTAIYVLSKEPDVSEIANQVQQISENVRAKPEVRFIKYRTDQDALNAQSAIQQQYEALGGSSQSSNEGVAPVLNYASPAAAVDHSHSHGHGHSLSGDSNLLGSGSSISSSNLDISSPAVNFGSASQQSSHNIDMGNIGSSSSNIAVQSGNEYLPPAVKK